MFLCFLNTVEFLTHYYIYLNLYNSAYFVTSVCQLLLREWFCSSIFILTECKRKWRKSTVLFESFNKKRKTLRANHGSFPEGFHNQYSDSISSCNSQITFLPNLHKANVSDRECNTMHSNEKSANYTGFFDSPCFLRRTSHWQKKYFVCNVNMWRAKVFGFVLKRFVYIGYL